MVETVHLKQRTCSISLITSLIVYAVSEIGEQLPNITRNWWHSSHNKKWRRLWLATAFWFFFYQKATNTG